MQMKSHVLLLTGVDGFSSKRTSFSSKAEKHILIDQFLIKNTLLDQH
jgi:hypothetical protein